MNLVDLIPVPIRGRTVYVGGDSVPLVPLRPFCDHLGIDWGSQFTRVKNDPALAPTVVMITTVAEDGKQREMVALPLNALFLWLAKINAGKVAPARQDLLIAFQMEAGMVLFRAWLGWRQGAPAPLLKGEAPDGALLREIDGVPRSITMPAFTQANALWMRQGAIRAAAERECKTVRDQAHAMMRRAGFTKREFEAMRAQWHVHRPHLQGNLPLTLPAPEDDSDV